MTFGSCCRFACPSKLYFNVHVLHAIDMKFLCVYYSYFIDLRKVSSIFYSVSIGLKKSLLNVFQDGICDPKMALVIDDRLKVWDDKDQPRVHVVPAFAPYYAPQAEVETISFGLYYLEL